MVQHSGMERDAVHGKHLVATTASTVSTTQKLLQGASARYPVPPTTQQQPWALSRLEFNKLIGRGYASRVWQCTDTYTGNTVAVKVYHKQDLCPLNHHQIHREAHIHGSISHPNILPFLGTFSDSENIYMVLQFCAKGDLYSYLKQKGRALSESQAAKYVVVPFLSTLSHLHACGIIHRDIKPENILVTDSGSLQLADFGLSIRGEHDPPVTRVGTLDYMAPEVVNCPRKRNPSDWKDRRDLYYSAAVDIWALGVLVYELCLGEPPFTGESKEAVQDSILTNEPRYSALSPQAADFVRLCLCKNPASRPMAAQLQSHPWLCPYASSAAPTTIPVTPAPPAVMVTSSAAGHAAPGTPVPATAHAGVALSRGTSQGSTNLSVRPPSRTSPGAAMLAQPRRVHTPPLPALAAHPASDPRSKWRSSSPVLSASQQSTVMSHVDSQCMHGQDASAVETMSSGFSSVLNHSGSLDVSCTGVMKRELSSVHGHAQVALDSSAMETQGSHASSMCMHGEQGGMVSPVDAHWPSNLRSEHTCLSMQQQDSISHEASALEHMCSTASHGTTPTGPAQSQGWLQYQ